nr:DUF4919 domain-containing protein [uncultured Flavobacterium sp.]
MNLKKSVTLLFIAMTGLVFGQEITFKTPDYKAIKANIENKKSKFYYPTLLKRLAANDTLLSEEQYSHLYYGYTMQPEYKPYTPTSKEKEIKKYYSRKNLNKKDFQQFIVLANQSLKEFPLDLRLLNYLAYMYHYTGNEVMARKVFLNFQGLAAAVIASGDGVKCETGLHVITTDHETVVLNVLSFESTSKSSGGDCDYLAFEKGSYTVPGMYFNIAQMKKKLPKPIKKVK